MAHYASVGFARLILSGWYAISLVGRVHIGTQLARSQFTDHLWLTFAFDGNTKGDIRARSHLEPHYSNLRFRARMRVIGA